MKDPEEQRRSDEEALEEITAFKKYDLRFKCGRGDGIKIVMGVQSVLLDDNSESAGINYLYFIFESLEDSRKCQQKLVKPLRFLMYNQ